ncbi:MAG: glycosyltransferase 87 family protein [Bacteroidia bacterium]
MNDPKAKNKEQLFLLGFMAAAIAMLGYLTQRGETLELLVLAACATGCGLRLYQITPEEDVPQLITAGFVLRLVLLFMLPNLSDDYFRFIWDGRLLAAGEQPFAALPSEVLHSQTAATANLTPELFSALNSPDYFTVYPPVAQFTFWLAAMFGGKSVYGSMLVLRIIQLLAEAGTLWLLLKMLRKMEIPVRRILLYALNPLVILELTGNLHAEALVIFFLTAALYFLHSGRQNLSAVLFGFSIASKLVPLLLLPLLLSALGWKRTLRYSLIAGGTAAVLFIPLLAGGFISHLLSSIDLYFQKFEFNASLYYVVREIGFAVKGYNIIGVAGPALLLLSLIVIAILAFRKTAEDAVCTFVRKSMFALLAYYLCASIVHPWYITPLILFAVLVPMRFPVVWSLMVWLSYAAYGNAAYAENYWFTAVEYVAVLTAFYFDVREMKRNRKLLCI